MSFLKSPLQRFIIILYVIISIAIQYPQPDADFNFYTELAKNYTTIVGNGNSESNGGPLDSITIVITGPTSGLGLGLTKKLYELGATIVAVGRSTSKLSKLNDDLKLMATTDDNNDSNKKNILKNEKKVNDNRFIPVVADFQDLDSVASAAKEIKSKVKKIDFLVNNAGMYSHDTRSALSTPQGFDLVFGVNYLSPFLLTEMLLPSLEKSTMSNSPRIIQISSTMHFVVDGTALIPNKSGNPTASQPSSSILHGMAAYGQSKLAQIYHSRSLSRDLASKKSRIQVISLCPSWVATHIAGANMKNILQLFAYDADNFGISPFLFAMFHPLAGNQNNSGRKLNDYVTSCSIFCNENILMKALCWITNVIDKSGTLRQLLLSNIGCALLPLQKFFATVDFRESSSDSYDVTKQDALFQWTKETLSPWTLNNNRRDKS